MFSELFLNQEPLPQQEIQNSAVDNFFFIWDEYHNIIVFYGGFSLRMRIYYQCSWVNYYQLLAVIIIIIKTSSTVPSGKNKAVLICPSSMCVTETKKNITQGSNQRLTAPLNTSSVPVQTQCRDSTFELDPALNTWQIRTFYTLILQTPVDDLRPQHEYVEL